MQVSLLKLPSLYYNFANGFVKCTYLLSINREAYTFVKERRACIKPNEGFVAQLAEYEPIYRARQTLEMGESSCETRRQKRKSEQLTEVVDIDLIQPPPSPSENNNEENVHDVHDISNNLHRLWLLKGV